MELLLGFFIDLSLLEAHKNSIFNFAVREIILREMPTRAAYNNEPLFGFFGNLINWLCRKKEIEGKLTIQ